MSSHLKAYIVVFLVSAVVLFFFRKPFSALVGRRRYDGWAMLWLVITSCAFLIFNFWLFIVVSAMVIFILSRAEPVKPAIYLLLLCATPELGEYIPGFAGINKFIEVNPQLVVAMMVLVPAMFAARHMQRLNKAGGGADLFFVLFLILEIALSIRAPSVTHAMRGMAQSFIFLAPLYYVFSRYPKKFDDVRIISAAFVLPVIILAATAIPEFLRKWHFYYSVSTNWFGPMPFGYVTRESYLRASASAFNPIVWGYISMCAIGLGLAVLNDKFSRTYRYAGFFLLASGLIVTLSRGPWVGAVTILGVYILISPRTIARAFQAGAAGIVAFAIAIATPFGAKIIDLIPFIGDSASETIDYRRQLLDEAWDVILQNPFFGRANINTLSELEAMRQGQGIIDIVNTYLQVGLSSGLIGLFLFSGFFISVLAGLRGAARSARRYDPKMANYCRAYLATLCGVLITIFTTSSEGQIDNIYWVLGALAVALVRIEKNAQAQIHTIQEGAPKKDTGRERLA